MSDVKRWLRPFYKMADVKALNNHLVELAKLQNARDKALAQEVLRLSGFYRSYESLTDYVPGSQKYQKILTQNAAYDAAQIRLAELRHTRVQVLDESEVDSLRYIYQHTYTINETRRDTRYHDCWDEGYETDEYYQADITYTFFSRNFMGGVYIDDIAKLRLSYIRKDKYGETDLIQEAIDSLEYKDKQLFAYRMADRLKIRYSELDKLFRIEDLHHWSEMWPGADFVTYKEGEDSTEGCVKYHDKDVLALRDEMRVAMTRRYIHEDKFTKYPNCHYVDFKLKLSSGEYTEYVEDPASIADRGDAAMGVEQS